MSALQPAFVERDAGASNGATITGQPQASSILLNPLRPEDRPQASPPSTWQSLGATIKKAFIPPSTNPYYRPTAQQAIEERKKREEADARRLATDGGSLRQTSQVGLDAVHPLRKSPETPDHTGIPRSPSIRFAPLPQCQRNRRANSITIGVASRAQLLAGSIPGSPGPSGRSLPRNSPSNAAAAQPSSPRGLIGSPASNATESVSLSSSPGSMASSPRATTSASDTSEDAPTHQMSGDPPLLATPINRQALKKLRTRRPGKKERQRAKNRISGKNMKGDQARNSGFDKAAKEGSALEELDGGEELFSVKGIEEWIDLEGTGSDPDGEDGDSSQASSPSPPPDTIHRVAPEATDLIERASAYQDGTLMPSETPRRMQSLTRSTSEQALRDVSLSRGRKAEHERAILGFAR